MERFGGSLVSATLRVSLADSPPAAGATLSEPPAAVVPALSGAEEVLPPQALKAPAVRTTARVRANTFLAFFIIVTSLSIFHVCVLVMDICLPYAYINGC